MLLFLNLINLGQFTFIILNLTCQNYKKKLFQEVLVAIEIFDIYNFIDNYFFNDIMSLVSVILSKINYNKEIQTNL